MAKAITGQACDMVGLGRPLTAEPLLCNDLLSGKVAAAKPNAVNELLQTSASILQLGEVSLSAPSVAPLVDDTDVCECR